MYKFEVRQTDKITYVMISKSIMWDHHRSFTVKNKNPLAPETEFNFIQVKQIFWRTWRPASEPLLFFLSVMFGDDVPDLHKLSQICMASWLESHFWQQQYLSLYHLGHSRSTYLVPISFYFIGIDGNVAASVCNNFSHRLWFEIVGSLESRQSLPSSSHMSSRSRSLVNQDWVVRSPDNVRIIIWSHHTILRLWIRRMSKSSRCSRGESVTWINWILGRNNTEKTYLGDPG